MSESIKVYLAGMGMITPLGAHAAMTAAAVQSGLSAYQASDHFKLETHEPIVMASVPDEIFATGDFGVDEGSYMNRIIIMAIIALREALSGRAFSEPVPLILALPEAFPDYTPIETNVLIQNLLNQKDLPLRVDRVQSMMGGRAAGVQALAWANRYLAEGADFVLVGASDSYDDATRIDVLDRADRLLAAGNKDGFAPGEAAGFLLLTRHREHALRHGPYVIGIGPPGVGKESGHLFGEAPYRGEGLDQAFKQALSDYVGAGIHTVYSSMNGEHHWAKEYGVAYVRNKEHFLDAVKIVHPADCYGDLGAATGPILIGLAAMRLLRQSAATAHLVYASSDGAARGAVRVEKHSCYSET